MVNVKYEIHPAILVLTKNTNLEEWIQHHVKLGFEHFFILDNNSTALNLKEDNITIIPYNKVELVSWREF